MAFLSKSFLSSFWFPASGRMDGEPSTTHEEESGSTANSSSRTEMLTLQFQPERFFPPPTMGSPLESLGIRAFLTSTHPWVIYLVFGVAVVSAR